MNVSRIGTFQLDGESVTGFFVSATIAELREFPFNPLLASVELHPLNTKVKTGTSTNKQMVGAEPPQICHSCGANSKYCSC